MKNFFRKTFLPWLARGCFDSDAAFQTWLQQCSRRYTSLRMILIVLAAVPLLVGYVVDRHGVMLLTILPLVLVLLLSAALDKIEKVLHRQNNQ